jgi:hypothetical protein
VVVVDAAAGFHRDAVVVVVRAVGSNDGNDIPGMPVTPGANKLLLLFTCLALLVGGGCVVVVVVVRWDTVYACWQCGLRWMDGWS